MKDTRSWLVGLGLVALGVLGIVLLSLLRPGPPVPDDRSTTTPSPRPRATRTQPIEGLELPETVPATPVHETVTARLAEAGGYGRVACRLPEGVSAASGPGLLRPRVADGWLFALVQEPDGQAPLRGPGGVVAHVQWFDAHPGKRGDCVTEEPRTPVEVRITVMDAGRSVDRVTAARLVATGCEGHDPPGVDGTFAVRALAGTPCVLRVEDRKTGAWGDLLVDVFEPAELTLALDAVDPTRAGRSLADVRQDAWREQLDRAEGWLQVLDAARADAEGPEREALDAERAEALDAIAGLRDLLSPR
ncbi:MAG: hypothetical protein H6734_24285 [Alphaproteobacteria bacterium]|nr:hypothetical protein [Alphaproteobacteria bacterium]